MPSALSHMSQYWLDTMNRSLEGVRRGLIEPYPVDTDPPPVTPYEVVYEGGKVRLRYYAAAGASPGIPLLLVYALIKRPYILDLLPGKSVIESLTRQGFAVYLTDWIPPTRADTWRGFDAYVNGDVAQAVRVVQQREGVAQVSLLGYCLGGLLTVLYTALHPTTVQNLITLTLPLDLRVRELPFSSLSEQFRPSLAKLITATYGNCPAWLLQSAFTAMAPVHHFLDKHVSLYRYQDRDGYAEMFAAFEQWMHSDVPLAGRLFDELMTGVVHNNHLVQSSLQIGGHAVKLDQITCPVLNVVGEYDDVVHPKSSLPLSEFVRSTDTRNLVFPTGHIGVVVSSAAHQQLWPQIGAWLHEHVL